MATETTSSKPDWQRLIKEYEEGASDVEIAKELRITINRFYELIQENPAFAEFVDRGRTLSRAWWESQGRRNLFNKDFVVPLWNFNMKNRFGWADKVDTNDTTNKEPVNLDEAKSQLSAALKTLSKKNPELLRHLEDKSE